MTANGVSQVKILQNITIKTAKVRRPKFKILTKRSCPICRQFLSLRQINRTTAIYLCDDLTCPYPFEENCPYPCITIQRQWKDINKPPPDDREWTELDWREAAGLEKPVNEETLAAEKSTELFDMIDSYVEHQSRLSQNDENRSFDDFLEEMFN